MAQRDRSQGFGFVYLDIAKLLKEAGAGKPAPKMESKPKNAVNLNRDLRVVKNEKSSEPAKTKLPDDQRLVAIQQIRENLDRLQALHHKLHAMLEELNQITEKKPR